MSWLLLVAAAALVIFIVYTLMRRRSGIRQSINWETMGLSRMPGVRSSLSSRFLPLAYYFVDRYPFPLEQKGHRSFGAPVAAVTFYFGYMKIHSFILILLQQHEFSDPGKIRCLKPVEINTGTHPDSGIVLTVPDNGIEARLL